MVAGQRRQIVVGSAALGFAVYKSLPFLRRAYRSAVEWRDPTVPVGGVLELVREPLALEDVESAIAESKPVVAGAARQVTWFGDGPEERRKTALSVVYVHGWGACRQEIAPTPQLLARALGANLYCHRLSGHGRRRERASPRDPPSGALLYAEATPRRLLADVARAFRVGLALGDRVVLVGVSTGGGLATWLAGQLERDEGGLGDALAALVLVSPCYGLGHPLYPLLKKPFTFLRLLPMGLAPPVRATLLNLCMGKTKRSPKISDDHDRYNTLVYPHPALLHLVDVLYSLEGLDVTAIRAPTFMAANQADNVIGVDAALRVFADLGKNVDGGVPKALFACPSPDHPHVLASQMLSPKTVDAILDAAILFVRAHTGRTHGLRRKSHQPSPRPSFGSFSGLDTLMQPFPF